MQIHLRLPAVAVLIPILGALACDRPPGGGTTTGTDTDGATGSGTAPTATASQTSATMSTTASDTSTPTTQGSSGSESSSGGTGDPACLGGLGPALQVAAMMADLSALATIADDNGGNRASGFPGYEASRDYAIEQLEAVGYAPESIPVDHDFHQVLSDATLSVESDAVTEYVVGADFQNFQYAAPGTVSAPLEAVDLDLGLDNESTSGCEPEDFASFTAGNIALVQRGGCSFGDKITNATEAGAVGVIIFNQGDAADPDRQGLAQVQVGPPEIGQYTSIPSTFTTYPVGEELAGFVGATASLSVDTLNEIRKSHSVVVETEVGDANNVLVIGAHLDSVPEGPGINDNGSGVAAVLEIARQLAPCDSTRKIRLILWGAEEWGLYGSDAYVAGLSPEELDRIALYLNFDMIASPNHAHKVLDGDGSAFEEPAPAGSDVIEQFFTDDFGEIGVPLGEQEMDFRSDYAAFIDADVPVGALFTGAEESKTDEEVDLFGGEAGVPYDHCYHQACDGIDNIDAQALEVEARSAARAVQHFGVEGAAVAPADKKPIPDAVREGHAQHSRCAAHAWATE